MFLDDIKNSCRYLLNNSSEAAPYLSYLNDRVIPEMQEFFEFGYFPGIQNINLLTPFVSINTLKENELCYTYEVSDSVSTRNICNLYFENHPLIMPYKNVYGEVVGLVGRSILSDDQREELKIAKYKNTKFEKKDHLFGLFESKESILKEDSVYIVEGQFDVIKAHEKGVKNIVAVGSSNLSLEQFALISRYTKNIFILFDNDAAGDKGRLNAVNKYEKFANIVNLYLPTGYKDIDEYLKQNDKDSMSFIVKNPKYSF